MLVSVNRCPADRHEGRHPIPLQTNRATNLPPGNCVALNQAHSGVKGEKVLQQTGPATAASAALHLTSAALNRAGWALATRSPSRSASAWRGAWE